MSFHQPQPPGGPANKLPIPRLERPREPPRRPPVPRQTRVSRACLSCRARKIKCNGAQPFCQNCADNTAPCVYVASRKDRLKTATEHNQDMLQLLQDLRRVVGPYDRQKIDTVLAGATENIQEAVSTLQMGLEKPGEPNEFEGEANVSAEVGSNEDLDAMDEDLLRNEQSRATGYMGKNTEVQWLKKLHREADAVETDSALQEGPFGPPGRSSQAFDDRTNAMKKRRTKTSSPRPKTSSCSFYLDDESLQMDIEVDPYELPPFPMAERLLQCYMQNVQSSFPIIAKKTFTRQFHHYYESVAQGTPYKLSPKWQAMLNLVLAIGASYLHLVGETWSANERDHILYHSRAWTLSLKDPWWFTRPDLTQMQTTALLALYYMTVGHLNRSWIIVGMSIRSGFALGLHIRNEDSSTSALKKEILGQTWWSVYSLDRTLSAITGRPSMGADVHCSVMLPLPISAEELNDATITAGLEGNMRYSSLGETRPWRQSASPDASRLPGVSPSTSGTSAYFDSFQEAANTGSFLASTVRLGIVSQSLLVDLYSPIVVTKSWKNVQETIALYLERLESWLALLPKGLNPFQEHELGEDMQQERNILAIYYYSTKIMISRPCLCRLDRRIHSQTQRSSDFNHRVAVTCIESAKAIASFLPDNITNQTREIYHLLPWWAVVHYMMQAITILLLEICYDSEGLEIFPSFQKLVRWLRKLKTTNGMARRAHTITLDLLKKLQDVSDLFVEEVIVEEEYEFWQGASGAEWFTGEGFLQRHPGQQQSFVDPFGSLAYPMDSYRDTAEPPPQTSFHEVISRGSPIANLFLTGYDQQNPFPFDEEDVFMQGIPGFDQENPPQDD